MSTIENNTSTWIETPLSKFGFKCVMNEHDFCADLLCECLCHIPKRITVALDAQLVKKLRIIQSEKVRKSKKSVSFSSVIKEELKKSLK